MPSDADKMEAKQRWIAANVELHRGNIGEYFKKADELHQFMTSVQLTPDDLVPILERVRIVPESFTRLEAIYGAVSTYSRGAATLEESVVESGYVSAIGKTTAFFMDCKLKRNERATPDPNLEVSVREVTVDIMKHIQHVASPGTLIGREDAKELMSQKILDIERLSSDDPDVLDRIYARKAVHSNLNLDRPTPSKLPLDKISVKSANLQADWSRESTQGRFLVNGIPLSDFAPKYEGFQTCENVLQFFDEVILKDFTGTPEQKAEAVDYLAKAFHQGGLLYPVSAAVTTSVLVDNSFFVKEKDRIFGVPFVEGQNINIQTTDKGFVVQEFCTFHSAVMFDGNENRIIKSPDASKPLIAAEGTIEVDFSEKPKSPSVTIKSNSIEINHPELVERLSDTRNFLQKFLDAVSSKIDKLKNKIGWNKVEPEAMKVEHIGTKAALAHQHAIKEALRKRKESAPPEKPAEAEHVELEVDDENRLC